MSNSFHFTGRVGSSPELKSNNVLKFTLLRNEYAGKDEHNAPKERVVSIQFVAFKNTAESIAKHVRKGDQLILEARIENNQYKDNEGVERYGYNFVVERFEFGAPGPEKRQELAARN